MVTVKARVRVASRVGLPCAPSYSCLRLVGFAPEKDPPNGSSQMPRPKVQTADDEAYKHGEQSLGVYCGPIEQEVA